MNFKKLDSQIRFSYREDKMKAVRKLGYKYISECYYTEYFVHKKNMRTIAKITDVTKASIGSCFKKWKFNARPQGGPNNKPQDYTVSIQSKIKKLGYNSRYEFLYDLYIKKINSSCEISRLLGIRASTIGTWLRNHNIPIRSYMGKSKGLHSRNIKAIKKLGYESLNDFLTDLYLNKSQNLEDIAKLVNVSTQSIRVWLKSEGIPIADRRVYRQFNQRRYCKK